MNIDYMDCLGRGQTNSRCEGCGFMEICGFVRENFTPKGDVKRALEKISGIELILRGEKR
jgi:hypothetical protein